MAGEQGGEGHRGREPVAYGGGVPGPAAGQVHAAQQLGLPAAVPAPDRLCRWGFTATCTHRMLGVYLGVLRFGRGVLPCVLQALVVKLPFTAALALCALCNSRHCPVVLMVASCCAAFSSGRPCGGADLQKNGGEGWRQVSGASAGSPILCSSSRSAFQEKAGHFPWRAWAGFLTHWYAEIS